MADNIISPAATRKLSRLKRSYAAMSPEEQLAFTTALRARRRTPERPLKAATIARRSKETTDAVQDS